MGWGWGWGWEGMECLLLKNISRIDLITHGNGTLFGPINSLIVG